MNRIRSAVAFRDHFIGGEIPTIYIDRGAAPEDMHTHHPVTAASMRRYCEVVEALGAAGQGQIILTYDDDGLNVGYVPKQEAAS